MNNRILTALFVVAPLFLLAACGGGGGGSADSQAVTLNTQLAIASNFNGGVAGVGTTAFVMVNEFEQNGQDLNGDFDFADNVMFMIDTVTGQRTNLGVAATVGIASNSTHIAWGVNESSQGNVDLNGDGDPADRVLVVFDPALPVGPTNPMNTGITIDPASPILGSDNLFVFAANELNAGSDLNGDTDTNDLVLQAFDTSTMMPFNTSLSTTDFNFVTRFDLILFTADEATQNTGMMGSGADLNGDTLADGKVLHVAQPSTMLNTPVGGVGGQSVIEGSYAIYGSALDPAFVYTVPESAVSLNMNGIVNDTDTGDSICAIFKFATMTEHFPGGGVAVEPFRYSGSSTTMTFSAVETENTDNGFDFNNDGDVTDVVPFWVSFANPDVANNLVIAQDDGSTGLPFVCGTSVLIRATEAGQGPNGTNYNVSQNDTDFSDFVFFHVDTTTASPSPTNLRIAGDEALCASESPDFVTIIAQETDNGSTDYNGDGDTSDEITFYFPITNGVISNNAVRIGGFGNMIVQDCGTTLRYIAFAPENYSIAFGDANDDGDFDDIVLQTIKVRKSDGETIATSVLGTVEPNIGANSFPQLLSPFILAFPSGESTIGPGFNLNANMGDPDMFDSILILGRLDCP